MALLAVCGAMIAWMPGTPAAGVVERAHAASIVADVKSKVIGALNATIALKKAGKLWRRLMHASVLCLRRRDCHESMEIGRGHMSIGCPRRSRECRLHPLVGLHRLRYLAMVA